MTIMDIVTHLISFVVGGTVGSLLTIKVTSNSTKTKQQDIYVTNGDVVGRDKN